MPESPIPPLKSGYLRGIADLLRSETDIFLSIGFVAGKTDPRWNDIQVTVADEDELDARATDPPPRIALTSGLLLLTHEAMSLGLAHLNGDIEVVGGSLRSALKSGSDGYSRSAQHGVIESEWGMLVLRLGERFADRVIDMTKAAVIFAYYHEFSHLLRSHHSILATKQNIPLPERELRRFLEKDADFHAAQYLMQRLMAGPISLQVTGEPRQSLLFLEEALLAIGIFFLIDDLRQNLVREEWYQLAHFAGQNYPHPLVRWGLVLVMLNVTLKASTHLHHAVPVTELSHELAERVLSNLGLLATFFGFPEDRWGRKRFHEIAKDCLQEYDHWAEVIKVVPGALSESLDAAYAANKKARETQMHKLCIVTDVTETPALREQLKQDGLPWADAEVDETSGELNFSGDPVDATLITVAGTMVVALCRSLNVFLRERKRSLTITSGEQTITLNNLTTEEIEAVLREAKALPVAKTSKFVS